MGFGYILIGYFISINFVYPQMTLLPALLLLVPGMLTLGAYNRPLREARLILYPTVAVAALSFLYEGGRLCGLVSVETGGILPSILDPTVAVLYLLFTWRLLAGIGELGEETGLPTVVFRAKRNIWLTVIFSVFYLFLDLPITATWYTNFALHAVFPALTCRLVVMLMNVALLFTCYRLICLPEDVDMPRHKTGIAFLDSIADKMDEKEDRAQEKKKQALADLYHAREAKYREKQQKKEKKKK